MNDFQKAANQPDDVNKFEVLVDTIAEIEKHYISQKEDDVLTHYAGCASEFTRVVIGALEDADWNIQKALESFITDVGHDYDPDYEQKYIQTLG